MSGPLPEGTFQGFNNCALTVTRAEGERTAAGFEQTSTQAILQQGADAQESGRALERAQQLYETGDVLVFAGEGVEDVRPGDSAELDMDDGRTLNGSVEEVISLDNSLLLTL
ncbi:hypothetical protein GGP85_002909 [Salinibacter ruber]|uniref:hypothetical protein n=1 Tax=Salinibacter ruber TaxID=146919 RepID=UPI002169A293|nr:hypothetical protein [Salinibacter ruber]MCS3827439.1 hypothetical protein [Salinibacter ruber]